MPNPPSQCGDDPGGTDARTTGGCTCPPEQIGPEFAADKCCPLHGLAVVLGETDMSEWVTVRTADGLEASAPSAEAAGRAIDRMRARRRGA